MERTFRSIKSSNKSILRDIYVGCTTLHPELDLGFNILVYKKLKWVLYEALRSYDLNDDEMIREKIKPILTIGKLSVYLEKVKDLMSKHYNHDITWLLNNVKDERLVCIKDIFNVIEKCLVKINVPKKEIRKLKRFLVDVIMIAINIDI